MRCPKCGAENPPKNKFCGECGTKMQSVAADRMDIVKKDIPESLLKKIRLTKDTVQKERRDVTVVFADISGFTTMSERLDPEELTLLMNECFRNLGAMVYRYEGIIDKFIGDCIMAIFGAPVTHEDDPERAILACLDMQSALNEINENLDPALKKLTIHSGVNTGEVIAGRIGSDLQMEYTVMGDTVNTAQRLKDVASSSSILVGAETYNRSRHAFDFMALEPMQLKGKVEKVRPYEVIGRKWGSEFGLGAVHSDLIGRDNELTQLKNGYAQLKKGRSSIYIIKGEIGVGKSRLLFEFKKFITISAPDIALIESRGVSYESSIPLKTFADALRHYFITGDLSMADLREDIVKEKLRALFPDKQEAGDILPYLYRMMNMTLEPRYREKIEHLDSHALQLQTFLAVTSLFENITKTKQMLLIIDDIQWLETTTIELINFLLPLIKQNRISIYLCYRVGTILSIKKLLATIDREYKDQTQDIEVKNLSAEYSAQLIDNLIGQEIPEQLKTYVIAKSGGNPFFIEEIVRRILESGAMKQKDITDETIQIPGSIDAAVTSRIDSLGKEPKYLLRISSIIGRSFPQELLEHVVKDREIYQHIDDLVASEFLVNIKKDNTPFYAFRHAMFQEVAYKGLLKSERMIYHKLIAETIENDFTEQIDGYFASLAHHYHHGGNVEKALQYSIKAGDEAAGLFANEEALGFYNQALASAETNKTRAEILQKIADIELLVGRTQNAHDHFTRALELEEDSSARALLIERIGRVLEQTGRLDKSIAFMEQGMRTMEGKDTPGLVTLLYTLSNILLESKAETKRAVDLVDQGLAIAQHINDRRLYAEGLRAKAHTLWRQGKNNEALDLVKESQVIYEELNDVKVMPFILLLVAAIHRAVGNVTAAIEYVKQAIEYSERIGNKRVLAMCYNNIGAYYSYLGEHPMAIDYTRKNVVIREKIGDKKGEGIGLMNIGLMYKYLGKHDKVLDVYMKALELFESINEIRSTITAYHLIGSFYVNHGNKEKAYELYNKGYDLAKKTGDPALIADAFFRFGDYYLDTDDLEKAEEYLDKSREALSDSADIHIFSDMYSDFADLYIRKKDPRAVECAERALKYAVESKIKNNEMFAMRNLGRAQAFVAGNIEEGLKNIKRSVAIAVESNAVEQYAHGLFALGEFYAAQGDNKQALEYLDQALKAYQNMDAKLWVKHAKSLIKKLKQ
jgi:adenylate cyclase